MSDEWAIQQLINSYTDAASRADWAQLIPTFAEDGVWEVQGAGLEITGHGAIEAAMAGFLTQFAYFMQINSPAVITVSGDRATARSMIRECGKYRSRDAAFEVLGYYTDDLVRTAKGWRFARRCFTGLGTHDFPLLPKGAG